MRAQDVIIIYYGKQRAALAPASISSAHKLTFWIRPKLRGGGYFCFRVSMLVGVHNRICIIIMPLGPGTMAGIAEGIADVDRQL